MFLSAHLASCEDGDIRLVNGYTEYDGQLEVCFDQKWGTVNGNGWSDPDTQVVCRLLGYETTGTCAYHYVNAVLVGKMFYLYDPIILKYVCCTIQIILTTGSDTEEKYHLQYL